MEVSKHHSTCCLIIRTCCITPNKLARAGDVHREMHCQVSCRSARRLATRFYEHIYESMFLFYWHATYTVSILSCLFWVLGAGCWVLAVMNTLIEHRPFHTRGVVVHSIQWVLLNNGMSHAHMRIGCTSNGSPRHAESRKVKINRKIIYLWFQLLVPRWSTPSMKALATDRPIVGLTSS